jgi:hypothetical protein
MFPKSIRANWRTAPKETARAAVSPGALAYRLLQSDWSLALSISRLDPWVTAKVFHDATIREGQLLTRVHISYRIENAAVKSLRVRIPGLDATAAATVRATGRPSPTSSGRGRNGLVGDPLPTRASRVKPMSNSNTSGPARNAAPNRWNRWCWKDVRQLSYFVAVRAGGRLELEAGTLPRGWQRSDWAVVQSTLGRAAGRWPPAMSVPRGRSRGAAAGHPQAPRAGGPAQAARFRRLAHHAALARRRPL